MSMYCENQSLILHCTDFTKEVDKLFTIRPLNPWFRKTAFSSVTLTVNNKLHWENGPDQPFYLGLSRENKDQESHQSELNFTVLVYLVLNKIFSKIDDRFEVELHSNQYHSNSLMKPTNLPDIKSSPVMANFHIWLAQIVDNIITIQQTFHSFPQKWCNKILHFKPKATPTSFLKGRAFAWHD